MAGGTLGILIPPSILAILYAVVAQQSVGELYMGSFIPGLMLSGMYVTYVLVRSYLNPKPLPGPAERGTDQLVGKDQAAQRADRSNLPGFSCSWSALRRYRHAG